MRRTVSGFYIFQRVGIQRFAGWVGEVEIITAVEAISPVTLFGDCDKGEESVYLFSGADIVGVTTGKFYFIACFDGSDTYGNLAGQQTLVAKNGGIQSVDRILKGGYLLFHILGLCLFVGIVVARLHRQ